MSYGGVGVGSGGRGVAVGRTGGADVGGTGVGGSGVSVGVGVAVGGKRVAVGVLVGVLLGVGVDVCVAVFVGDGVYVAVAVLVEVASRCCATVAICSGVSIKNVRHSLIAISLSVSRSIN